MQAHAIVAASASRTALGKWSAKAPHVQPDAPISTSETAQRAAAEDGAASPIRIQPDRPRHLRVTASTPVKARVASVTYGAPALVAAPAEMSREEQQRLAATIASEARGMRMSAQAAVRSAQESTARAAALTHSLTHPGDKTLRAAGRVTGTNERPCSSPDPLTCAAACETAAPNAMAATIASERKQSMPVQAAGSFGCDSARSLRVRTAIASRSPSPSSQHTTPAAAASTLAARGKQAFPLLRARRAHADGVAREEAVVSDTGGSGRPVSQQAVGADAYAALEVGLDYAIVGPTSDVAVAAATQDLSWNAWGSADSLAALGQLQEVSIGIGV